MPLTNAGRDLLGDAAFGAAYTPFNAANSYIGIGDSTTAFAAAQTDLQAATNKLRKAMQAGYPVQTPTDNVLVFRALIDFTEGNWAGGIKEWGVFNAASGGTMLTRKQEDLGVKPSTEAWLITATLTLTAV